MKGKNTTACSQLWMVKILKSTLRGQILFLYGPCANWNGSYHTQSLLKSIWERECGGKSSLLGEPV
jgi:hypothetical protein